MTNPRPARRPAPAVPPARVASAALLVSAVAALLAGAVAALAGCSAAPLSGAAEQWQKNECQRLRDAAERQRCAESNARTFDEFRRQQAARDP